MVEKEYGETEANAVLSLILPGLSLGHELIFYLLSPWKWKWSTPWTAAYQAPLSMGFSRQEYWRGLPFSSPGYLSQPRDRTRVPRIADRHFTIWATGKPCLVHSRFNITFARMSLLFSMKEAVCPQYSSLLLVQTVFPSSASYKAFLFLILSLETQTSWNWLILQFFSFQASEYLGFTLAAFCAALKNDRCLLLKVY